MGNSCQHFQQNAPNSKRIVEGKVLKIIPLPNQQNKVEKFNYPLQEKLDSFNEDFFNSQLSPGFNQQNNRHYKASKDAAFEKSNQRKNDNQFDFWLKHENISRHSRRKSLDIANQIDRYIKRPSQNKIKHKNKSKSSRRIQKEISDVKPILKRNLSHSPQSSFKRVHFDLSNDQILINKINEKNQQNNKSSLVNKQLIDDFLLINPYKNKNIQYIML